MCRLRPSQRLREKETRSDPLVTPRFLSFRPLAFSPLFECAMPLFRVFKGNMSLLWGYKRTVICNLLICPTQYHVPKVIANQSFSCVEVSQSIARPKRHRKRHSAFRSSSRSISSSPTVVRPSSSQRCATPSSQRTSAAEAVPYRSVRVCVPGIVLFASFATQGAIAAVLH